MTQKNILSKGFTWFANNTYRKQIMRLYHRIPTIIQNLQNKSIQAHYLTYQSLNSFPKNAKNIGFDIIRRAHKKKYNNQSSNIQKQKKYDIVQKFIRQKAQDYQKPMQLVCPICMDFFCGPVSTTCGHTFCFQCLDQAILFNPSTNIFKIDCPVCRNQIRGEQLIICKSLQTLILSYKFSHFRYFYKFQDQVYKQAFQKKQKQFQDWMDDRTINQINISQDQQIDVRDTQFVWCKAKILKIYQKQNKNNSIMVHYEGWSQTYDQIIYLNSQRLANFGFYTNRKQIPHYNLNNDNQSHMHSYVVMQRNQQNVFNFNHFNHINFNIDQQDQMRITNLIENYRLRNRHPDIIDQQHSIQSFSSQITFLGIHTERSLSEAQELLLIERRNQEELSLELHSEGRFRHSNLNRQQSYDFSDQDTNSLVNIEVQWSEQNSNSFKIQNRHEQEYSLFDIQKPQETEEVYNLLDLIKQEQAQNQQDFSQKNSQSEECYGNFLQNIWKDWNNYKQQNGLLQTEKNEISQNNNKIEEIQQKQEKNTNKQYYNFCEQQKQQNEAKLNEEQQNLSILEKQTQEQYEYQTFKQLCRQFDSQFKNELQKQKKIIQMYNCQKYQKTRDEIQKLQKNSDKQLQIKEFNLYSLYQFNPQTENEVLLFSNSQKSKINNQKLINQADYQYDKDCELNQQISNFINRLVETAQKSYTKQILKKQENHSKQ